MAGSLRSQKLLRVGAAAAPACCPRTQLAFPALAQLPAPLSCPQAYVNELAGCLVETNGQPPCPERIKRLVDEVCLLCTRVALCNPAGVKHFTLTKVGGGRDSGARAVHRRGCALWRRQEAARGAALGRGWDPPACSAALPPVLTLALPPWLSMQVVEDASGQHADDRVPQMVRALSISPQQRSQLSQLRRLFLQKLAKIVNDRKDINALLLVGGGGLRAVAGCSSGCWAPTRGC